MKQRKRGKEEEQQMLKSGRGGGGKEGEREGTVEKVSEGVAITSDRAPFFGTVAAHI